MARQAKARAQQRLGRRRPEHHEGAGPDEAKLRVEPRFARVDLAALRALMDAPLAAFLELEVLDDVGDVDVAALDPDGLEGSVELATGRSHERTALAVLAIPGYLPDEHDARPAPPLAKYGLRGVAVQVAPAAPGRRLAQALE